MKHLVHVNIQVAQARYLKVRVHRHLLCCCQQLRLPRSELSVTVVNSEVMTTLNRIYRGFNKTTDVLSFPQDAQTQSKRILWGDIIVDFNTAKRQAIETGKTTVAETLMLITHGLLHLLGHDHHNPDQASVMFKHQQKLLEHCYEST